VPSKSSSKPQNAQNKACYAALIECHAWVHFDLWHGLGRKTFSKKVLDTEVSDIPVSVLP